MIRFSKLLGEIFMNIKSLSKKAFTNGLVIISAGMVTVLLLGTNGFIVQSKTNPDKIIQNEEKAEEDIDYTLETTVTMTDSEQSQSQLIKEEDLTKEVLKSSKQKETNNEDVVIYTEEDYIALVNIVEAEATGEDVKGKILVANVVLNRVKSDRFPNTIYEVVYQENSNGRAQFSPIDDGRMGSLKIQESTYEAVERALKGEDYSNGALFFVARSLSSAKAVSWFDNNLQKVTEHGVHEFYTY